MIKMIASFSILVRNKEGLFTSIDKESISALSPGGFAFIIEGKIVPFDFNAFSCSYENNEFEYESGRGPFFNEYEISDCYDEELKKIGLTRNDLSAEYLSSVSKIDEFFIYFIHNNNEIEFGDNTQNCNYRLIIKSIEFVSIDDNGNSHSCRVCDEIIKNFNNQSS